MRRRLAVWLWLASTCGSVAALAAPSVDRVPRPEFDGSYRPPATSAPAARPFSREALDVLLLGGALVLASELAVRRRSRRGLVWLSVGALAYFGFVRGGCVCPIGSLQNVARAAADRSAVLPATTAAVFALPLAFALWRGRVFCAGVCPAGALQDLVLVRPRALPSGVADPLSFGRHLYLGMAVLLAATGSAYLVCSWDPFVSLFHLSGHPAGVFLAALFIAASTVVARPYCRFLCPYGVLLGWAARCASRRATCCPGDCISCRLCEDACPVGALRPPADGRAPEPVASGVRRLSLVLGLTPFLVVGGALLGARLEVTLARLHPTVQLAERLLSEDANGTGGLTLETRTFRAGVLGMDELRSAALGVRREFRWGGAFLGGYLALVFAVAFVRSSRWQRRAGYGPDSSRCLACGRCFAACPQARAPLSSVMESAHV